MLLGLTLAGLGTQSETSGPLVLTYIGTTTDTVDRTTYTFSSASIGTASSDRIVLVCAWGRGTGSPRTISSVTIGGSAATAVVTQFLDSSLNYMGIYALNVTSGTTADIVVTFSAGQFRCAVGVYTMTGKSDPTTYTAYDSDATDTTDPIAYAIDIPAGGCVVGMSATNTNSTATVTGMTENYDSVIESTTSLAIAGENYATEQTGLTVQFDWASAAQPIGVFASWGP